MSLIQRNVRGSEAEKEVLRFRFTAMRIWNGFSSLFFTLNPNDIKSPLTLAMADRERFQIERRFSLDLQDDDTDDYLKDLMKDRPRLLHEMVAQDPIVATRFQYAFLRLIWALLYMYLKYNARIMITVTSRYIWNPNIV